MATNFPTSLDTFTNPSASSDEVLVPHATQHQNHNDSITALETKVGVNNSVVTTTHDYKLSEVTGTDKSVGKTATQVLTNKTLTTPVINVGSDTTGDMYYRNGSGQFTRLPVGSTGQVVTVTGGLPTYQTPAATTDASYSVKGQVQGLTDAATSGLTLASGVISVNSGTSANQIVKLNGSSQLPAVSGALLTNIMKSSNGTITISSSGTTTITTNFRPYSVKVFWAGDRAFSNGGYDDTSATMFNVYNTYNANGGTQASGNATTKVLHAESGTNPIATTATINNITSTSFDIVRTFGSVSATIYWSATGY